MSFLLWKVECNQRDYEPWVKKVITIRETEYSFYCILTIFLLTKARSVQICFYLKFRFFLLLYMCISQIFNFFRKISKAFYQRLVYRVIINTFFLPMNVMKYNGSLASICCININNFHNLKIIYHFEHTMPFRHVWVF